MMILFILKVIIILVGLSIALVNGAKYMETKDKTKLKRAAIFFFGAWFALVLIDGAIYAYAHWWHH